MEIILFSIRIYWCVLDGADCNRQFIKIHFKNKDPVESKFMTTNLYTGEPMIFIMDPKVQYMYFGVKMNLNKFDLHFLCLKIMIMVIGIMGQKM